MKLNRYDAECMADAVETEVDESYSGRGMYGATCIAFAHSASQTADLVFAAVEYLGLDVARELFYAKRTDNMGLDMVAYFPGVALTDDEEASA